MGGVVVFGGGVNEKTYDLSGKHKTVLGDIGYDSFPAQRDDARATIARAT